MVKGLNYTSKTEIKKTTVPKVAALVNSKPPGTVGSSVKTKPVFSNNLVFYAKGSKSFGGGVHTVSNSGAVSRRT
jgi:hypothetical protein